MLSSVSHFFTWFLAGVYALLGLTLFLTPEGSSAVFAWKVSPFVTMTIGAWCLGNAVHAWDAARQWRWPAVYPSLIYLWSFGVLEAIVLIAFNANLALNGFPALLYLVTLIANFVAAVVGVVDVIRSRPTFAAEGGPVAAWVRVGIVGFVLLAGYIAYAAGAARPGGAATEGGFFPDKMTLFTVRAFAAFYGAVGLAAVPLILARGMAPILGYGRNGIAFIIPITAAALFYFSKFDFVARPGGAFYLGVYVVLFVGAGFLLLRDRSGQGGRV